MKRVIQNQNMKSKYEIKKSISNHFQLNSLPLKQREAIFDDANILYIFK